jgi:hypothetical protein
MTSESLLVDEMVRLKESLQTLKLDDLAMKLEEITRKVNESLEKKENGMKIIEEEDDEEEGEEEGNGELPPTPRDHASLSRAHGSFSHDHGSFSREYASLRLKDPKKMLSMEVPDAATAAVYVTFPNLFSFISFLYLYLLSLLTFCQLIPHTEYNHSRERGSTYLVLDKDAKGKFICSS